MASGDNNNSSGGSGGKKKNGLDLLGLGDKKTDAEEDISTASSSSPSSPAAELSLTTPDSISLSSPSSHNNKSEVEVDEAEEVRRVGAAAVDEVLQSATHSLQQAGYREEEEEQVVTADTVKEHDVAEEEAVEAARIAADLAKELEENDGWVKILGNDELMKKVIEPGESDVKLTRGDLCQLSLEGRLEEDESVVFQPLETIDIQLGDAEVIPGLDLAIPLMNLGEVATIRVSGRFGFSSKGLPPFVPPNAALIYRVHLIKSEAEKELGDLGVSERREIGNRKRIRGNWWYGRGETSLAVNCYRRALEFLDEVEGGIVYPSSPGEDEKVTPELRLLFDDRLTTLNNLAMAQLKLQSYEAALTSVEAVLKCQPNNVKALFRKGKILGAKLETEKALEALYKAKSLQPEDNSISMEILKLTERAKREQASEKMLYKRMFKKEGGGGGDSSDDSKQLNNNKNKKGGLLSSPSLTLGLVLSGAAIAVAGVMAYRYNHRFL